MDNESNRLERRAAQRFEYQIPLSVRLLDREGAGCGFTQDLSSRGILLYTDLPLSQGDCMEVSLVMPSEVTMAENARVRCRGLVLRVRASGNGGKSSVAMQIKHYEFLPETDSRVAVSVSAPPPTVEGLQEDMTLSSHTFEFRGAPIP